MKNTILILLLILVTHKFTYAQLLHGIPCYTVSSEDGQPNVLFKRNIQTDEWNRVGITGGTSIDAIATDWISKIIYATDGGTFGTINLNTALFNAIGNIGLAIGSLGSINLNDIDGLTYDNVNQIMYATHRIEGIGPGTNDLLFQIDVSTGSFVPGAMTNATTGAAVDYVVIPAVFEKTFGNKVYNVNDIGYDPYLSRLFALQNQDVSGVITELNVQTGEVERVVFDLLDDDVKGIAFTYLGELLATTGEYGLTQQNSNAFMSIDIVNGSTTLLNNIDLTGVAVNFESLDCFSSGSNDLALDMIVSYPISSNSIYPGDNVIFSITIYNQGDFDNYDITLTDYVPSGLLLNDASWTDKGNGTAYKIISGPLAPGASITVQIAFTIDPAYVGDGDPTTEDNLINTAEISSSYNDEIADFPLLMPDFDSFPDDQNNEINIVDNEINQGGPDAKEDEDDHDIETIKICTTPFETNYSGCVPLNLDNNQNILKNNYAVVYDYSTCNDYTKLENCTPVVGVDNLATNEALWTVTKAAEYFFTNYNIQIPKINIIVNSTLEPNQAKYNYENNVIILGAGDGVERSSMSAPDILAHEYVYAIFSSINYLGNFGIPGALNESYADIFAELIEYYCYGNTDWIFGSQVMAGNNTGIRNLSNPKDETMEYQMPDTYEGEYWVNINNNCFDNDNCGIHTNSGVHSYWFYLLANGGTGINENGYAYNVNGIGIEKATAIVFDNLIHNLNPILTYRDAREGSISVAKNLFGIGSAELSAVIEAWNAVGVTETPIETNYFETNYSGTVTLFLDNNQTILKNEYATIYEYSTCTDYTKLENCTPVIGSDNLSANEALWAITKAAKYFSIYHDIKTPKVNIIVNDTLNPNIAKYNIKNNVIVLGAGDGIERNSMAAPDIIAHEYTHAIFNSVNSLGNFGISGALNESYADIFGELVEYYCYGYNDWIWGGQIMVDTVGNYKGLRNLSMPKDKNMKYQLPNTNKGENWIFNDKNCFHIDNCGIHTNSGVQNYWFYLLVNGGTGINDDKFEYNVNGVGIENATEIVFDNWINYLNPLSTYKEARNGSIKSNSTLYGSQPEVLTSNIVEVVEAWNGVGVYNVRDKENPTKFRITNDTQTGKLIEFDLSIDSLDLDLTAEKLCFSLHLPHTYVGISIESVYEPLTTEQLSTNEIAGEFNICIDRLKTGVSIPKIKSNSSILGFKVFISPDDIGGDTIDEDVIIESMQISGYTKVDSNKLISFKSATLPFSFDYNEENSGEPQNSLEISLQLYHKNCQTLGAIEIEMLNSFSTDVPPYTYKLNRQGSEISDSTTHQFYNLEEGEYELEVKDSNADIVGMTSKKFRIDFVGEQSGSLCCSENLIIPAGNISGKFNADSSISFSNGTLITEGAFEICDY